MRAQTRRRRGGPAPRTHPSNHPSIPVESDPPAGRAGGVGHPVRRVAAGGGDRRAAHQRDHHVPGLRQVDPVRPHWSKRGPITGQIPVKSCSAARPTGETSMHPAFAKRIRSGPALLVKSRVAHAGRIRVKPRSNAGQMLVNFWSNAGQILVKYWSNTARRAGRTGTFRCG